MTAITVSYGVFVVDLLMPAQVWRMRLPSSLVSRISYGTQQRSAALPGSGLSLTQSQIPSFSRSSTPLTLVRFKCMLQDTGYPMEVYMQDPPAADEAKDVDWSKLKERWVGWATESARKTCHIGTS